MKPLLLLATLLLASCASDSPGPASPSAPTSGSTREDMERKLIGFQEKYDRFDYNGDGDLTPKEVSDGLATEQIEGITRADVPKIFAYYDTNRNGRISLREINAAYQAGPDAALRAQEGR